VPIGIDINNNDYWALTGNYNAQVEAYRAETATYKQDTNKKIADVSALVKTNKDDIDANLNALHANTVNDATNLYNQIQKNTNDIKNITDKKNIILFIGDSIVNGYGATSNNKRFSTVLAQLLGMQEINHSSPGAGFVHISTIDHKTLQTCTTEAINDNSFDHKKVKYLILEGGINDNNSGNINTQINNIMQQLKKEFTNAKYYFINTLTAGGMTTKTQATTDVGADGPFEGTLGIMGMYNIINTGIGAALYNQFTPLPGWKWLSFNTGYSTDGTHPTDNGHAKIAYILYSIINNKAIPEANRQIETINLPNVNEATDLINNRTITTKFDLTHTTINKYKYTIDTLAYGTYPYITINDNSFTITYNAIVNITTTDKTILIPLCKLPDKYRNALYNKPKANPLFNTTITNAINFSNGNDTTILNVHYVYDRMANTIYAIIYNMPSITAKDIMFTFNMNIYTPTTYTYRN
jgi:lysophospholipase L1-like esterase